jgi:hypothetical protein
MYCNEKKVKENAHILCNFKSLNGIDRYNFPGRQDTYWLKVKLTIARKKTDLGAAVANLEI